MASHSEYPAMPQATAPLYYTIGTICSRYAQPLHRVRYAIDSRHIAPEFSTGNARLFSAASVEKLAHEMGWAEGGSDES